MPDPDEPLEPTPTPTPEPEPEPEPAPMPNPHPSPPAFPTAEAAHVIAALRATQASANGALLARDVMAVINFGLDHYLPLHAAHIVPIPRYGDRQLFDAGWTDEELAEALEAALETHVYAAGDPERAAAFPWQVVIPELATLLGCLFRSF